MINCFNCERLLDFTRIHLLRTLRVPNRAADLSPSAALLVALSPFLVSSRQHRVERNLNSVQSSFDTRERRVVAFVPKSNDSDSSRRDEEERVLGFHLRSNW